MLDIKIEGGFRGSGVGGKNGANKEKEVLCIGSGYFLDLPS
jgi:hypothetical protein